MKRSATKKKPKGRRTKSGKRKPVKNRQAGGGMPNRAQLQQMQQQMGGGGMPDLSQMGNLPKGMDGIDLDNLDFNEAMKRMGGKKKF